MTWWEALGMNNDPENYFGIPRETPLPSAADLDAVEADKQAAEETK